MNRQINPNNSANSGLGKSPQSTKLGSLNHNPDYPLDDEPDDTPPPPSDPAEKSPSLPDDGPLAQSPTSPDKDSIVRSLAGISAKLATLDPSSNQITPEIKPLDLSSCLLSSEDLCKMDVPKRPLLLGSWLCQGDLGYIFAPRGVGKTWLAMSLPVAVSKKKNLDRGKRENSHPRFSTLMEKCPWNSPEIALLDLVPQKETSLFSIMTSSFRSWSARSTLPLRSTGARSRTSC